MQTTSPKKIHRKPSQALRNKQTTVRLPEYALADLRREAKANNMSLNSLLSMYILDGMYHTPNEETLEAIEEARSGVEMDTVDMTSFESFCKSCGL